ncbi:MAG: serine/threonine protein kinase, partial [Myxococcales bacterium]|nr:serine/threonine protein kinase [Myxococcales bacterium]
MAGGETPLERVGDYEVCAPIAEGGMASVWLARSIAAPERLVALKVIKPEFARNQEFVAMFLDESRIASRLSHPNIVSVVAVGRGDGQPFLAMELLRGPTLLALGNAAHARGTRLPCDVVAWIGARLADALHYAHERVDDRGAPEQLVHRDVNPANVIVTRDGIPKLIDFGLAKARDRIASTAFGIVKGKLAYLAPEQAHGRPADRRSDVFALGVTLWETSLDRRLFLEDTDVETIRRVREAEVPDPLTLDARYPRGLAEVVRRALARDPDERYQTAAELRDALDRHLSSCGRPVSAADVRAVVQDLSSDQAPAAWEKIADESLAEREKTRLWEGSRRPLPKPAPPPRRSTVASRRRPLALLSWAHSRGRGPWPRALAAGLGTALLVGLLARGCRAGYRFDALERRVARLERAVGVEVADTAAAQTPFPPGGGDDPAAIEGT